MGSQQVGLLNFCACQALQLAINESFSMQNWGTKRMCSMRMRKMKTLPLRPRCRAPMMTTHPSMKKASRWSSLKTKRSVMLFLGGIMASFGDCLCQQSRTCPASCWRRSPLSSRLFGRMGGASHYGALGRPWRAIIQQPRFQIRLTHMISLNNTRLTHFSPPISFVRFQQAYTPLRRGIAVSRLSSFPMAKQDEKPAKRAKKTEDAPARKSKASAQAEGKD